MEDFLPPLQYLRHRAGSKTVEATQGSNSASKTFTVTSSTIPTITLNPTSGPVGTSVTVTGVILILELSLPYTSMEIL